MKLSLQSLNKAFQNYYEKKQNIQNKGNFIFKNIDQKKVQEKKTFEQDIQLYDDNITYKKNKLYKLENQFKEIQLNLQSIEQENSGLKAQLQKLQNEEYQLQNSRNYNEDVEQIKYKTLYSWLYSQQQQELEYEDSLKMKLKTLQRKKSNDKQSQINKNSEISSYNSQNSSFKKSKSNIFQGNYHFFDQSRQSQIVSNNYTKNTRSLKHINRLQSSKSLNFQDNDNLFNSKNSYLRKNLKQDFCNVESPNSSKNFRSVEKSLISQNGSKEFSQQQENNFQNFSFKLIQDSLDKGRQNDGQFFSSQKNQQAQKSYGKLSKILIKSPTQQTFNPKRFNKSEIY